MADGHNINWREICDKDIKKQKSNKNIKRDLDVIEICLNERKLESVCNFKQYPNLKYLWLSNNRLRHIDCLGFNFRITELHLQYNFLKDITGALSHLTQIEVLMLQGNQLTNLEKVIKEFRRMQNLQILNMFDNPLAQEKDYRHYTIYHIPSVAILDRKEVQSKERSVAKKVYDQKNEMVRETIAFLRRSQGPPDLYYRRNHDLKLTTAVSPTQFFQMQRPTTGELETAFNSRVQTKALWTYNYLDWSQIPSPHERRINRELQVEPEVLSVAFK
ncbi:LRRC72 [Bugula neritina]|uniref:LRRC72 n=1 Tax=Bugula neritina TaxID=10212 RepID=A0A7J7JHQ2_BUGNE|nr:LRRC72 [Bugula neritina]